MKWYFFKTLREKRSLVKGLRKGKLVPFIKYVLYRFRISPLFHLKRKWYRMRVFYSPYAFWLWTHEDNEKDEELFFESFIKEGDVVIDCGAHIGTLTITASRLVGRDGCVIAYEAHPRTFSYLQKNVHDNNCQNVTLFYRAVGEKNQEVSFSDYYASDLNSVEDGGVIPVMMTTLDSSLKDLKKIDLLKLDIEGCELPALRGGEETLKKTKAIYFESAIKSFSRFNYSLEDVVSFLKERGFACYRVEGKTIVEELGSEYTTKVRYENILAIKDSHD